MREKEGNREREGGRGWGGDRYHLLDVEPALGAVFCIESVEENVALVLEFHFRELPPDPANTSGGAHRG